LLFALVYFIYNFIKSSYSDFVNQSFDLNDKIAFKEGDSINVLYDDIGFFDKVSFKLYLKKNNISHIDLIP
jgi:hypothetical protein